MNDREGLTSKIVGTTRMVDDGESRLIMVVDMAIEKDPP